METAMDLSDPKKCREFLENIASPQEKIDLLLYVSGWILALVSKSEIAESEREACREVSAMLKEISGHKEN